jgi:hypothetical protein
MPLCTSDITAPHRLARQLPHKTSSAMTRHRERDKEVCAPRAGETDMASGTCRKKPAQCPFAGDLLGATLALGTGQVKMRYQRPAARLKCLDFPPEHAPLHESDMARQNPAKVGIQRPPAVHIRARIDAGYVISVLSGPLKAVSSCAALPSPHPSHRPRSPIHSHRLRRAPDHA